MIYFKGLNGRVIFLYHLNLLDKSAIDLYASYIGKIIKYIIILHVVMNLNMISLTHFIAVIKSLIFSSGWRGVYVGNLRRNLYSFWQIIQTSRICAT